MRLGLARSLASVLAVGIGVGLATCCRNARIKGPRPGDPGGEISGGNNGRDGGAGGAGGSTETRASDAAPSDGVVVDGSDPTIDGAAVGLFSETYDWVTDFDPSPSLLLYFQSGTDGGVTIYSGTDYDPAGPNIWFDERRTGDAPEGETAIWYRHPPLGADSPTSDAHNASSRDLWRTFTTDFDLSAYRYFNVWVRPLDGYEGHLGIGLGSWNPAEGGRSGDDGAMESHLFPQRIRGDHWQCLSIPLSTFESIDFRHFAKYVFEFPSAADGRAFLLDHLTFSVNPPRAAGPPDPELYRLTEPGEDPRIASDEVLVRFDRSTRHQTVRGFGFFGDSPHRERLITDLGASLIRFQIPAGDPPEGSRATRANTWGWEPVNDDADPDSFLTDLSGFDTADVSPVVDAMRAYRSYDEAVQYFACAWSPPGWMKTGGRVNEGSALGDDGNRLRDDAFEEYGEYLAAFALHLHREGVPLAGLSMGNEVHFNHEFASMRLVGEDMLRAIEETASRLAAAEAAVPGFTAPRLTTDDHVLSDYFFESGFVPLLEGLGNHPDAGAAVDVVSYHSYGVDAQTPENVPNSVLARLRSKVDDELGRDVELWMTETSGFHNGLLDEGDRKGALRLAEGLHTSLVYGEVAAWVYFGAEGLLHYGRLSWPGHILRHFARFVRPGAVRFEAMPASRSDRVLVSAFEGPEPSIAVIIVNLDDTAHGLDLSGLPMLSGYPSYLEVRSSHHHAGESMGSFDPASTAATPFVMPPHGVVTLYQGPPVPEVAH